ncbi:WSC-domain-containing protein [Lentinus tigrinus ALCF2SS1-6]|uniref:WSC-domain-containing protein n=1 Tax=Lentinus tigrinus ALCF2SS1-6 TaxID=1328759 RepID=A0A5C2RV16_9APHY|nr:WSC-domain-containing protein [Lentinus tigrinus ALCF2SS1-6]
MAQLITITILAAITTTVLAIPFNPGSIPLNWTTYVPCAVDVPSRVITGVVTTVEPELTAASCIESCDAQNYIYAGVENGNECHCGSGIASSVLQSALPSDCNFACTGDASLSCGGAWRIQLYKSPALLSGAWAFEGCYVDTPDTPAFAEPIVHHTFETNVNLFTNCLKYCGHIGLPWAGLEDASDCQCSFGLAPGVVEVDRDECGLTCPGPFGEPEQCGGVQRLYTWKNIPVY